MKDIREVLDILGVPFQTEGHEHCREGWLQIDCPWCNQSGHYRLGYNLSFGYLNCWSCGSQRLIPTLIEITGKSYGEIKDLVSGIIVNRRVETEKIKGTLIIPDGVEEMERPHRNYLKSRGFDAKHLASFWGVKGISLRPSHLKWRLFIPVTYHGEVVTWTTRTIGNSPGNRYLNAKPHQEKISLRSLLYGEDFARNAVIVCEGPTDVWRIGPGAVATMGVDFTPEQAEKIAKYPLRAICFDNLPDTKRQIKKLVNILESFPGETIVVTLDSKDPGEATEREIKQLRGLLQ